MAISSSNLVDHLAKWIHKIKCKYGYDNKKSETCEIKYKVLERVLNTWTLKMI